MELRLNLDTVNEDQFFSEVLYTIFKSFTFYYPDFGFPKKIIEFPILILRILPVLMRVDNEMTASLSDLEERTGREKGRLCLKVFA